MGDEININQINSQQNMKNLNSLSVTLSWNLSASVKIEPKKLTLGERLKNTKTRLFQKKNLNDDIENQTAIKNILHDGKR